MILPGLINAHDHLEFALFPRLGRGPYPDATAWAEAVYHPNESPLREHLRVPKRLRLLWGGLRNLLAGVTTVCHHNPWHPVFEENFPVRVARNFAWAHSLRFSADLVERFRAAPPEWPFVVHAGEGINGESAREIHRLHELGALDRRTVLVHAVALDAAALALIERVGAAIVWCPQSNLFTLGRTLPRWVLESGVPIALGTDSALTAEGDLLDELCHARRIFNGDLALHVTTVAARILRLEETPDYISVPEFGAPPDLAVIDGRVKLISPERAAELPRPHGFTRIEIEGRPPVLVDLDVPALLDETTRALGAEVRLAGRRVFA